MRKNRIEADELLSNQDFIDWALNPTRESDMYWKQWLQNHPEKQEEFLNARYLVVSVRFDEEAPSREDYDETLSKILNDPRFYGSNEVKRSFFGRRGGSQFLSIAASLLILFSVLFVIYRYSNSPKPVVVTSVAQTISKNNPAGQKSQFQLPDGTMVWLNSESSVSFTESFSDSIRLLQLEGEAFFEVISDSARPFIVNAGDLRVKVLGTSFNVNSRKGEKAVVSLVEGSVKIAVKNDEEFMLEPGEQLVNDNGKITGNRFDIESITGWRYGLLVFDEVNFNGIIRQLETWYGVEITVHGDPVDYHYQGKFLNKTLEEVLDGISYVMSFEYELNNNKVTIRF